MCGAVDRLTGAVCTQPPNHPGHPSKLWTGLTHYEGKGRHVDATNPGCLIVWDQ